MEPEIERKSGVTREAAFQIDKVNLYERLGGQEPFVLLSTAFHERVYSDSAAWFRDIFAGSAKAEAIRNPRPMRKFFSAINRGLLSAMGA